MLTMDTNHAPKRAPSQLQPTVRSRRGGIALAGWGNWLHGKALFQRFIHRAGNLAMKVTPIRGALRNGRDLSYYNYSNLRYLAPVSSGRPNSVKLYFFTSLYRLVLVSPLFKTELQGGWLKREFWTVILRPLLRLGYRRDEMTEEHGASFSTLIH